MTTSPAPTHHAGRVNVTAHPVTYLRAGLTLYVPVPNEPGTSECIPLGCSHNHETVDAAKACGETIRRLADRNPAEARRRYGRR